MTRYRDRSMDGEICGGILWVELVSGAIQDLPVRMDPRGLFCHRGIFDDEVAVLASPSPFRRPSEVVVSVGWQILML